MGSYTTAGGMVIMHGRTLRHLRVVILLVIINLAWEGCLVFEPWDNENDPVMYLHCTMTEENYHQLFKSTYYNSWFGINICEGDSVVDARLRIHGNVTRKMFKKSFQYRTFSHSVPRKKIRSTVLSAFRENSCSHYRYAVYFFSKTSLLITDHQPVRLYINQKDHGLYLKLEKIDEHFFSRRNLPLSSLYKMNARSYFGFRYGTVQQNFDKKIPDDDWSFDDLIQLNRIIEEGITEERLEFLWHWLDSSSALDYYAISRLIYNWDGINNNVYLYYNSRINKFQFIPWDLGHTFEGSTFFVDVENGLVEQLLEIPHIRSSVENRMAHYFDYPRDSVALDSIFFHTYDHCQHDIFADSTNNDCIEALYSMRSYIKGVRDRLREMGYKE
ncbi:MAG: hypothetical protein GF401_08760 [Chitinivibrionales bacterium]|nr:hypothetical protein [Chitinivibrionales bacterium]